jgi:protein-disulfide isomerase
MTGPGFADCVHGGRYGPWVRHVTDAATARGVTGTPTVYVDGRQVEATAAAVAQAVGG